MLECSITMYMLINECGIKDICLFNDECLLRRRVCELEDREAENKV